jgi:propanol-preferring alcohol dehydrogenase
MRAMLFDRVGAPLRAADIPMPDPAPGQLLLKVKACGVCRTDLHLLDGEVQIEHPPRVLGHQIVAVVEGGKDLEGRGPRTAPGRADDAAASELRRLAPGSRVGVPWLGWTCGECRFCRADRENLCERARFTGRDIDGGMAQWAVADARFCFPLPAAYPDEQAAPLLCAGLIGWRALRMCGDAKRLGLYGFGAAAHIIAQVATWQGREVYAMTRGGDTKTQAFARKLGAVWAGAGEDPLPAELDAAIVFAPDGALVPAALRALSPGGTVVCGGIHMSDIPSFPYELLWHERSMRSVANLTRADGEEFLALAPEVPVQTQVTTYPLAQANEALADLRAGRFSGAAVLIP